MKLSYLVVAAVVAGTVGCAALRQASEDYQAGKSMEAAGETHVWEEAADLTKPLEGLPASTVWLPSLTALVGTVGLWRVGRQKRKGQTPSERPISGWLGSKTGVESLVQGLANVFAGIFEHGADGSTQKRVLKTAIAAGIPALLLAVPSIREWYLSNATDVNQVIGQVMLWIGGGTVALLGTEKALSAVKPLAPQPPTG